MAREKQLAALELANRVRFERADWKHRMRRAPFQAAAIATVALLRGVPWWAERMRVADVIDALPGIGPARVTRVLRCAMVPATARIGGLTERQREALVDGIRHLAAVKGSGLAVPA
jgi:hypothetical protein